MNDSKIKVIAMQKLKWSVWNMSPIGDFKMDGFVIKKCCFLYTKLNCHNDQWIKADYVVYFLQKWLKIKNVSFAWSTIQTSFFGSWWVSASS